MGGPLWKLKPQFEGGVQPIRIGPAAQGKGDGLWFGQLAELVTGNPPPIWISTAKEQVIAIVGKRGSGKSFTLGVLCEGLTLEAMPSNVGLQTKPRAVLLFDPLDIYWTTRLSVGESTNAEAQKHFKLASSAHLDGLKCDVEAWIPGTKNRRSTDPDWFSTLQLPVGALGLEEWELLLGISVLSDPMGQALVDALRLVTESGYLKGGNHVAAKKVFGIQSIVDAIQAEEIAGVYHAETLRALRQRLGSLASTDLFAEAGTNIHQLLAPGRLTVILLERLPQSYRSAVIAVLTKMVVDNRSVAAFIEKRLALDNSLSAEARKELEDNPAGSVPHVVIALDEAQTVLAPGTGGPAKDVFVRLVKEGRNLGLTVALATQQPSAMDQKVLSQVETFVAHQLVTEADIRAVRDNLKSSLPDKIEFGKIEMDFPTLLRSLGPGQCVVSAADSNLKLKRTFVMNVRPRATVHGGIEL